jgi:Leucine rich repeat
MSGSTQSLNGSGNTADINDDNPDDTVLWSDNVEREYFQSILNERIGQGRAAGDDSLIGDSTMASILGDHRTIDDTTMGDGTQDDDDQPSFTLTNPFYGRSAGDGDTVDNIEEAGSIVAWFRRRDRSQHRHPPSSTENDADGTTLESAPDIHPSDHRRPTGLEQKQRQQQQIRKQQLWKENQATIGNDNWASFTSPPGKSQSPSRGLFGSRKKQKQQQQQQPPHQQQECLPSRQNNVIIDHEVESGMEDGHEIPGYIIVTSGQSSAVQTRTKSIPAGSNDASNGTGDRSEWLPKSISYDDDDQVDHDARRGKCLFARIIVVVLLVLVIAASVSLAVIVTQRKNSSNVTSLNNEADGSFQVSPLPPLPSPTTVQPPIQSPNSAPVDVFEMTGQPSSSPTNTEALATFVPSLEDGETALPTVSLSISTSESSSPTTFPSSNILETVLARVATLSPGSVSSWSNPNTPQSRALAWLTNDPQVATAYSDRQLLQRYFLATFYYSTNGAGWNVGNEGSWLDVSTNECGWSGVECATNSNSGDIRVIRLIRRSLAGELPPEIDLLSDTLEEVYLNSNYINGTIPATISRLTNLRRLNIPANLLVGTIPSQMGDMQALEVLSMKNNKLTGTIPVAFGRLTSLGKLGPLSSPTTNQ